MCKSTYCTAHVARYRVVAVGWPDAALWPGLVAHGLVYPASPRSSVGHAAATAEAGAPRHEPSQLPKEGRGLGARSKVLRGSEPIGTEGAGGVGPGGPGAAAMARPQEAFLPSRCFPDVTSDSDVPGAVGAAAAAGRRARGSERGSSAFAGASRLWLSDKPAYVPIKHHP